MKIPGLRYFQIVLIILIPVLFNHCEEPANLDWWGYNNHIKGYVIDETTNEPIAGASIKLWIENYRASSDTLYFLTDTNGVFVTEKIPNHTILVEVSKNPEYKTIIQNEYEILENSYDYIELTLDCENSYFCYVFPLEAIIHSYRVIPDTLDFRNDLSSHSFSILNTGTGQLEWQLNIHDNWITADIQSDTIPEKGFDIINLQVDRSLLTQGNFSSSVDLISNAGDRIIPVYLTKD